jgi:putative transcriptional regulator
MRTAKLVLPLLLILVAAPACGDPPPRAATPSVSSLDGQLVVATRKLTDPHFARTVIFMVAHTGEGAMGLVVNRVFGAIALKDLFGGDSLGRAGGDPKVELRYGGPVDFNHGFVLHSADYLGSSTQVYRNGIALTASLDIVRAVAEGRGPKRSLFLSGYAGWGAGQLEHEIARGDWLVAPADPELLFSADPGSVWEQALRSAGLSL